MRNQLIREKFAPQSSQQATEQALVELKKMDLFDLGVLLLVASTGGLDVISEEVLSQVNNIQGQCCIFHAIAASESKQSLPASKQAKSILAIKRVMSRLSLQAQEFICKCLQQRFSSNEMKKQQHKMMTTSDLLTHAWIMSAEADSNANSSAGIKKKKTQIKGEYNTNSSGGPGASGAGSSNIKVTLKELLNVSSDWKEVNKKNPTGGPSVLGGGLPMDFQSQQIERIAEAIALTLPSGGSMPGGNNTSFLGGIGGTISTNNIDYSQANSLMTRYDDQLIRELAFDLGVDRHSLKGKL